MNPTTEQILTEKIEEQAKTISRLSEQLKQSEVERIDLTLRKLRLHGAILLHVGPDFDAYQKSICDRDFGGVGEAVAAETWSIDRAPITVSEKAAIRSAANNGMDKW